MSRPSRDVSATITEKISSMKESVDVIATLPERIDYAKLDHRDWRKIGKAGVHYRSRVFLSYHYRDDDPKKDENQKMIDDYIKPTLDLLNVEPVTSRDHLKPQELIDDKIGELVRDCDGIIGFYTKDDSISNIEHELSQHENIVAICKEEGALTPSMRLSRFQINFNRTEMGDLLMKLISALKGKQLFRLVI